MKKCARRFGLILWLLAVFASVPVMGQDVRAAGVSRHTFWQVEGKSNTVYLLGSIHLLKSSDYPLAEPIEAAFSNSSVAVFETDIEQMEAPESQMKLMNKAQLPEGETLKNQLSPELYTRFNKHLEESGLPAGTFDQFKPSVAAVSVEVLELLKLGADPQYGVDQYFFTRARKAGKDVVPLETVDFQIGLITEFTKEESELLMKSTLEEMDNTKKLYGEMVTAWRTGDGDELAKLLNDSMADAPVIYKRLVTDRNRRWVPKIEDLLRGGRKAVVIVGAGHLVGTGGVVELLRKDGWKVTQM